MSEGWIGVDLDGTLAHYDGWKGMAHIGAPVEAMFDRVRAWIDEGREVRIFTARVCRQPDGSHRMARRHIINWLEANGLPELATEEAITNVKDFAMVELWDDRAVQVEINTGLAYVHPHGRMTP
jgi:hypothetical protein